MAEIVNIKRACEKHLAALVPSVVTAYEGVNFDAPSNAMYQRCQFTISSPDDPVFGTGYHRERVQFQVFVVDPLGKGTTDALQRAELIRLHFAKGTTLVEGTTPLHVLTTPQIAGNSVSQGKVIVPVLIDLVAEVY